MYETCNIRTETKQIKNCTLEGDRDKKTDEENVDGKRHCMLKIRARCFLKRYLQRTTNNTLKVENMRAKVRNALKCLEDKRNLP